MTSKQRQRLETALKRLEKNVAAIVGTVYGVIYTPDRRQELFIWP